MSRTFVISLDVSEGTALGFLRATQKRKSLRAKTDDGTAFDVPVLFIYPTDDTGHCSQHTEQEK